MVNKNIPSGAYVTIAGDFNTDSHSSNTEPALGTLESVVVTTGPYPADKNGNENTNSNRNNPYDGAYVSANLNALATATVIGSSSFANGLVADTRVFTPIFAIAPASAFDSAATNMQHMGVVRDFMLAPEPGSILLIFTAGSVLLFRRPSRARAI